MDRKELENVSEFLLGEENTAYAPYFIGKSYLSLLNNKEVIICNVTFEQDAAITGIFIMVVDKY